MHRLEGRFKNERALVVFGGPSILENSLNLSLLKEKGFMVFLESKALTPRFLDFGLSPDFYLMIYPEKSKSNSFQTVMLQARLAGIDLKPLVREELHDQIDDFNERIDEYFVPGKQSIAHKRLQWRADVFMPGSPFDLFPNIPKASLITFKQPYGQYVKKQAFRQPVFSFDARGGQASGAMDGYYKPAVENGVLTIRGCDSTNSAIILFSLLRFMGFGKVYFLGMDMSMLGSFEYAAPYTFRSMKHFGEFFERARGAFSASFPRKESAELGNRWHGGGWSSLLSVDSLLLAWRMMTGAGGAFLRPRGEFLSLRRFFNCKGVEFVNVHAPYRYASKAKGIRNIGFNDLLKE